MIKYVIHKLKQDTVRCLRDREYSSRHWRKRNKMIKQFYSEKYTCRLSIILLVGRLEGSNTGEFDGK